MVSTPADDDSSGLLDLTEFHLVRRFLWWVVGSLVLVAAGTVVGSWQLGMEVAVEGEGAIEPSVRCQVRARVAGVVDSVLVVEGQRVAAGQVLVLVDDLPWRQELAKLDLERQAQEEQLIALGCRIAGEQRVCEAGIVRAERELALAQAARGRVLAEAELEGGLRDLLRDWQRRPIQELVPVRQATAQVEAARAQLHLARTELSALDGREREVAALKERRDKLLVERERVVAEMEDAAIRSPVSGTVLTGQLQQLVGGRLQRGQAILELAGEEGWLARVEVDERDRPRVRPGQPARVYARAFPHMEYRLFSGTVTQVAEQPTAPSSSYAAEIALADPTVRRNGQRYQVRDGMTVTARIVVDRGRIASLVRRRLLRHLGRRPLPEVYRAEARSPS